MTFQDVGMMGRHGRREGDPSEYEHCDPQQRHLIRYGTDLAGVDPRDPVACVKAAAALRNASFRENAAVAAHLLFSASPEFFRPEDPAAAGTFLTGRVDLFETTALQAIRRRYGPIAAWRTDLDEGTPTVDVFLVPIVERRTKCGCKAWVSYREVFGGPKHEMRRFQTWVAEQMAPIGLVRGIPVELTGASHRSPRDLHADLARDRAAAAATRQAAERLMDSAREDRRGLAAEAAQLQERSSTLTERERSQASREGKVAAREQVVAAREQATQLGRRQLAEERVAAAAEAARAREAAKVEDERLAKTEQQLAAWAQKIRDRDAAVSRRKEEVEAELRAAGERASALREAVEAGRLQAARDREQARTHRIAAAHMAVKAKTALRDAENSASKRATTILAPILDLHGHIAEAVGRLEKVAVRIPQPARFPVEALIRNLSEILAWSDDKTTTALSKFGLTSRAHSGEAQGALRRIFRDQSPWFLPYQGEPSSVLERRRPSSEPVELLTAQESRSVVQPPEAQRSPEARSRPSPTRIPPTRRGQEK